RVLVSSLCCDGSTLRLTAANRLRCFARDLIERHQLKFFGPSELPLGLSLGEALLTHGDPDRNPDQVRILEFYTRPLVAVVIEGLDTLRLQLLGEGVRRLAQLWSRSEGQQGRLERRARHRPHHPLLIVV